MSDCSSIIRVGIGAAQALCRKPGSNKVSFFFPTAKIGAEAPESGGVELWILATGGERTVRFFTSSKCWCLLVHHWQEDTETMERPSLLMHQERAHFFQWDGWVIAVWRGETSKATPHSSYCCCCCTSSQGTASWCRVLGFFQFSLLLVFF